MESRKYTFAGDDFVTALEELRDAVPAVENQVDEYRDAWEDTRSNGKTPGAFQIHADLTAQTLENVLIPHSHLDTMVYMEDIEVPVKTSRGGETRKVPMRIDAASLEELVPGLKEIRDDYPVRSADMDYAEVGMPFAVIDLAGEVIEYWDRVDAAYDTVAEIEPELDELEVRSPVEQALENPQYRDQAEYILSKAE